MNSPANTLSSAIHNAASTAGRVHKRNRDANNAINERTSGNATTSKTTVTFAGEGLSNAERDALALLKAVAIVEKLAGIKLADCLPKNETAENVTVFPPKAEKAKKAA